MKLDRKSSLYIDLLRILAAGYVFFYHIFSDNPSYPPLMQKDALFSALNLKSVVAHYYVIIFFVLSGFLITMTLQRKGQSFIDFTLRRLGRLYSVVIPALIFSFLVAYGLIGLNIMTSNEVGNMDYPIVRFFLNLTFLSQSWTLVATPPLNGPFWSLGYEFAYYMLLGSILLIKPQWLKWAIFILFAIVSGIKVILLFPCWLAGAGVYYLLSGRIKVPILLSSGVYIISCLLLVLLTLGWIELPHYKEGRTLLGFHLYFSWNYLSDYIFCLIIAANLLSFVKISPHLKFTYKESTKDRLETVIRNTSNSTFTLYLFHSPLLVLFTYLLPVDRSNTLHLYLLIFAVLICVYFIAQQTEWKTTQWRDLMFQIYNGTVKTIKRVLPGT
jgi:peptidoglycan/LPS O-acetylase OafA/YrhL